MSNPRISEDDLAAYVCGELDAAARAEVEAAMASDPTLAAEAARLTRALEAATVDAGGSDKKEGGTGTAADIIVSSGNANKENSSEGNFNYGKDFKLEKIKAYFLNGFTLIEVMIGVSIFSIFITSIIWCFITLIEK